MKQKKHKNITGLIQRAFLQNMGKFNCLKELKWYLILPEQIAEKPAINYRYPDIICSMIKMIRKNHKYSEECKKWEDLQGIIKYYKLDKMNTYQERFNALDKGMFIHWNEFETKKIKGKVETVEVLRTL